MRYKIYLETQIERKKTRFIESNTFHRNDNRKGLQIMCVVPQLTDLDLTDIDTIAIDLETYDPNLKTRVYARYFIMQCTTYVGLDPQLERCHKDHCSTP